MGIASLALLAALAVPGASAPAAPVKAPVAEQLQVSRPPPRAASELVAQPVEVKPGEPATPPRDAAGTVVADPAPPPADPAPSGAASGSAAPAPPASAAPGAATPAAPAPATAAAAPPPPAAPAPATPPAAPGFSTDLTPPLPPVESGVMTDAADTPAFSPPAWPWAALAILLLLAAGAAYWNIGRNRRRLAARTRSMLSLQPRLDRSPALQPPPRLAFAGPSAAIRTRLEPGAARTWTE